MAIQPLKRRVVDQRHATPITARWESRAMRKQFPVRTLRNPPRNLKSLQFCIILAGVLRIRGKA